MTQFAVAYSAATYNWNSKLIRWGSERLNAFLHEVERQTRPNRCLVPIMHSKNKGPRYVCQLHRKEYMYTPTYLLTYTQRDSWNPSVGNSDFRNDIFSVNKSHDYSTRNANYLLCPRHAIASFQKRLIFSWSVNLFCYFLSRCDDYVWPASALTTMVKTFQAYLPQCHRTYSCIHCRAHLANHDELISKV